MKLSDSSDSVPQASNDDDSEDELQKLLTLEKDFQDSKSKQSISSVLSAVSEKVMIRCGYQYDMDQRKSSQPMGLFYDQVKINMCLIDRCSILVIMSLCGSKCVMYTSIMSLIICHYVIYISNKTLFKRNSK